MKTILACLSATTALVLWSGCVISVGGRTTQAPPPPPALPALPATTTPGEAATCAEIDAAARLDFDAGRRDALVGIAGRPELSSVAQVHLVNVTYRCLSFDDMKLAVLRKLIANPAFADAARQAMVSQLNLLAFDANRQAILRAVNERVSPPGGP